MNILKEFSRRIEKFFTISGTKPTIPEIGTTHQDTEWLPTDIYQGELAVNLGDGKLYSSDGKKLIHLNRNDNYIVNGMVLRRVTTSLGANIPFWVTITSGELSINNKRYEWNEDPLSVGDDNGNLQLAEHWQTGPRIDYVFAVLVDDGSGNKIIDFDVKSSYAADDLKGIPTINVPNNSIFLGVVFIPEGYNQLSTYSLGMYSVASMFPSYPVINFEPFDFIQKILRSTLHYKPQQFYYVNQLVLESYTNPNYDPVGSPTPDNYPTILSLWGATRTNYAFAQNPAGNGDSFAPMSGDSGTPGTSVTNAVIITPSNQGDYPGSTIGDLIIIKSDNTTINAGTANANYVHTQVLPNDIWVVDHGLEMYPNVTIVDNDNTRIYAGIQYIDDMTLEITFSEPLTGFAYLS